MRISTEEEVVFKDFDDLEKALKEMNLPELANSIGLMSSMYFLGKNPKDIFKSYIKSRKHLIKLLKRNKWKVEGTVDALKTGIKMYSARDYLDGLLEDKEKELERYINCIQYAYPQLLDLSRKRLVKTAKRLVENPSYISRIIEKVRRQSDEDEYSPIVVLNTLKVVLHHPKSRYVSHASMLYIHENLNADKVVKIINGCRKHVLKNLSMLAPKDFYERASKAYEEQNMLIKLTDKQERFEIGEMNDKILLDSLLKNLCPHEQPHYAGVVGPREFLYKLMECPNVAALLATFSRDAKEAYQIAVDSHRQG